MLNLSANVKYEQTIRLVGSQTSVHESVVRLSQPARIGTVRKHRQHHDSHIYVWFTLELITYNIDFLDNSTVT